MGWFGVLRIGVSDLHHSRGTVGIIAAESVGTADDGVAAENMGPAVLTAEDGPLGEHGQPAQGGGAIVADGGIGQNLVVECNVDAVVIAVKGHGLHFNAGIQQLGAAGLYPGTGIQNGLGAGGQIDTQVFNAVLITAGVGNFAGVNGHGLLQVAGIAAQGVHTLLRHVDTS